MVGKNHTNPAVGNTGAKTTLAGSTGVNGGAGKGRVVLRPADWAREKEKEKENEKKEKAKSVISKLVIEETSKNNSSPRWSGGLKTTNTT